MKTASENNIKQETLPGCRELKSGEISVGYICGGRGYIKRLKPKSRKWCFGCHKRTTHSLWLLDQEWYDPEQFWKCGLCNQDKTEFPQ